MQNGNLEQICRRSRCLAAGAHLVRCVQMNKFIDYELAIAACLYVSSV